jgi:bifunctional UDP-N-acetylglucosamine pyrophosphorylase / glucosamine-1-phosphate N-acetyltransferase
MSFNVVVMAAGKGTRMKSATPKVLHKLAGRPLLQHVLDTCAAMGAQRVIVVTGHGAVQVQALAQPMGAQCVLQEPQLGTGHAVQQALPALDEAAATTLILNGDVPLIEPASLKRLLDACAGERLALLTLTLADATGYGRILRAPDGRVLGNVEHKDASEAQRQICEVYTGVMAAPTAALMRWVQGLKNDNVQKEYYLPDVIAMAVAEGVAVVAEQPGSETEVLGINSPAQLADLERRAQARIAHALLEAGVRLADPARLDVRGTLVCGRDVEIDVGCVFEGEVSLGDDVRIGPYCVVRDATLAAGSVLQAFTHIEGDASPVQVGEGARIGPFARLRPGAVLGADVHIGNFVEVKNSTLAAGAKANHLAYLGDASVGERVNYGAGSITANYDGANKHRTVIEADAHIGSNCVLVAPLTVGAGATIGGGSTLSKDAPAGQLTVARARAVSVPGWVRPKKSPKA